MAFRLTLPAKGDVPQQYVEQRGDTLQASSMVEDYLAADDWTFRYYGDDSNGMVMEARKSPWHWYQAGLYVLHQVIGMGEREPSLTGTIPEPGEDALADLAEAARGDDREFEDAAQDADEQDNEGTPLDLSGSAF